MCDSGQDSIPKRNNFKQLLKLEYIYNMVKIGIEENGE
jgi:hypothetical protein